MRTPPYENPCGVCEEGAVLGRRGGSWGLASGSCGMALVPCSCIPWMGLPFTFGSPTNATSRGVGMQCVCVEMYLCFSREWSRSQGCLSSRSVWTTL